MEEIAVLGANGRMGQAVIRLLAGHPTLRLRAALTERGHPGLGGDVGTLAGLPALGVHLSDDLGELARCRVAIDFSVPAATGAHLAACQAAGCGLVLGTTGLDAAQSAAVDAAARHIPVIYSRNMSLGVAVLTELATTAARLLGPDFDVEITEAHHRDKKDAPSGTALQLGEAVASARGAVLDEVAIHARHGLGPARPRGAIGFASIRGGAIVGEHAVIYAGDEEVLTLSHHASDRALFARGAIRAAAWLCGRKPARYTLRDVLGLAGA